MKTASRLILVLLLSSSCKTEPKDFAFGANDGNVININGKKIYYEEYGQGTPLLLLSGGGIDRSIRDFGKCIPNLSKRYRVIAPDTPGQGRSEQTDSLSYDLLTDFMSQLIDSLDIDSAYVVGWSDGGINGLLMAIRHPEKVKKLAITGANLQPDTTAVSQEIWDMVTPSYNMLKAKTDKNEMEKGGFKLLRLLIENPHIPLTDLQKNKLSHLGYRWRS